MARWSVIFLLALAVVVQVTARNVPSDAGLGDQKNVVTFSGVGGYSGLGDNGMPIGGVMGAVGAGGGGLGGPSGVGGLGGAIGYGPGGLTGGVYPFGGVTNIGGAGGTGAGSGSGGGFPLP